MKRQHTFIYTFCTLLAVGVFLLGCTQELDIEGSGSSHYIRFQTSIGASSSQIATRSSNGFLSMEEEDWPLVEMETKAAPQTALSGDAGLIGFTSASAIGDTPATAPWASMYNQTFDFDNEELKAHGTPIKWSATNSYLRVYAYAPKDFSAALSADDVAGVPTLTYTVPTAVASQTDLLAAVNEVATSTYKASGGNMPLNFNHALTAIRFKVDFACTVKKLEIKQVYNNGVYKIGGQTPSDWTGQSTKDDYTFDTETFTAGGTAVAAGGIVTDGANTLMLMPQTVPADATVVLTFDSGKTITASIAGHVWEPGKRITYTISQTADNYIYFDLAAGNVSINATRYLGYIFENGNTTPVVVYGSHSNDNQYYVYQSSTINHSAGHDGYYGRTGFLSGAARVMDGETPLTVNVDGVDKEYTDGKNHTGKSCTLPNYDSVIAPGGTGTWSEYITNIPERSLIVENIIESWPACATAVGRESTISEAHTTDNYSSEHKIYVSGLVGNCNMTIDNLYTRYQAHGSTTGGSIGFIPDNTVGNNTMTIRFVGDNRIGSLRYVSSVSSNKLVLEGSGSLTVADGDATPKGSYSESPTSYNNNHYDSAIGGTDSADNSLGIVINSGVLFSGTTAADQCTAIGGGGNGPGSVTINGGTVTAVATTTGTAIGGGIGFSSAGGPGTVTITGGNVYAYNHRNVWDIPSSAIGGAGANSAEGNLGQVTISGGNVYAQSGIGTAIGGGSSKTRRGGDAVITITGGNVIARSVPYSLISAGCGIGGGTGCSGGGSNGAYVGGNATVTITGGSILTGSIGGGATRDALAHIGTADITIGGTADIQAQFVMEAGAGTPPSFTMTGGRIRNSNTSDAAYAHIIEHGGAVYMEDGTFNMSGGTIDNCSADLGGAVYVGQSGTGSPSFTMSGSAVIQNCTSTSHGGAVYLEGGSVTVSDGTIDRNRSAASGGGIYVSDGSFSMSGGNITGNYAATYGGGIAVTSVSASSVDVSITGGNIQNNWTYQSGGGISVIPAEGKSASVTLGVSGLTDPDISGNGASISGGGVYVKKSTEPGTTARLTINGGKIKDNVVSTLVANPDVDNDGGMVILNDGDVTHVVVTYHMNDGSVPETTATQKIVTATRSILSMPSWSISGYSLTWSDNPSAGLGTLYTDGQEVNLTTGLHLYAIWTALP